MENEFISTEQLERLIDNKNVQEIRHLFEVVPEIDLADAARDIEDKKKIIFILKTVKSEFTAQFFTELDPEIKEELVKYMSDDQLADVLESQFTDDIVDDLEELPANVVTRVLKNVPKEKRETINKLLNFKEDTAGSIMTTEFVILLADISCDDAIKQIRKTGKNKETIYTIFVMDRKRNLVGVLDLDDLIFADGDTLVSEIMNKDFNTVNVNDDQEEVANVVKRYDLNAVAVLNNDGRLVGIVTVDDVVDVIAEESAEDIANLQHVTPLEDSYMETTPIQMAIKCVPWIVVLLVLGTFSSLVLSKFENSLQALPLLAAFIPVVMDTSGNAGGQTIALMIRGLAMQEFEPKNILKILAKEILSALIIALCIAVFGFIWFTLEQLFGIVGSTPFTFSAEVFKTSALVAVTLAAAIFVSKIVAVLLPLGAAAIKKDPAIVSQPLLTTIVDVSSLLIYFGLAALLFPTLL